MTSPLQRLAKISDKIILPSLLLVIGLSLGFSWMSPQVSAPNERTRIYLSLAMLERGELSIDKEIKTYGRVFDLSKKDGHFYTDKAPGSSFLAMPTIAAYKALHHDKKTLSIEQLNNLVRHWVMIPFTLLTLALTFASMTLLNVRRKLRYQLILALALGTPLFHYGAAFYGHALVLCFTMMSCWALLKTQILRDTTLEEEAPNDPHHDKKIFALQALSSFAAAMCFFVEYQGAIFCIAFALAFLSVAKNRRIKPILAAAIGAAPPVLATLIYNTLAFGGPLTTSYQYLAHASSVKAHNKGLFGIMLPTADSLYSLFLSPSRSLLFCAPIALMGAVGCWWLWKKSRAVTLFALFGIATATMITLGFHVPFWGFGQRLMVPILGVTTLAAATMLNVFDERKPLLSHALKGSLITAMIYNVLVSTAFPEFPAEITSPLHSVALHMINNDSVSTNLGGIYIASRSAQGLLPLYLFTLISALFLLLPNFKKLHVRSLVAPLISVSFALLLAAALWYAPEDRAPKKLAKWQNWAMNLRWDATAHK